MVRLFSRIKVAPASAKLPASAQHNSSSSFEGYPDLNKSDSPKIASEDLSPRELIESINAENAVAGLEARLPRCSGQTESVSPMSISQHPFGIHTPSNHMATCLYRTSIFSGMTSIPRRTFLHRQDLFPGHFCNFCQERGQEVRLVKSAEALPVFE
jgi:hypothetical protein